MLIKANLSSNKTEILTDEYAKLLNSGVPASEILALVQNSGLKNKFVEKTLEKLEINTLEKLQVHSFFSLVYNTIIDNWAFIENNNPYSNPAILPNLAGLEVSQFILKNILKEVPFKGYNSKKSLLHQLFRRYSLIVQNNLTDEDVEKRSAILKESFAPDAKEALGLLLRETLRLRDFDYLRQSLVFNFIYKNTNYFAKIKYLIADDADEVTPICFDFIKHLAPQLNKAFIAFDPQGISRTGYLSADRTAVYNFEEIFNETPVELHGHQAAEPPITLQSLSKRASMLEAAAKKINELLSKDVLPSEISVVTPVIDDMLKFTLKENIKGVNLVFLSGSEKLIQNRLVKAAITILKLKTSDEFDLRTVLSDILGIPVKYCKEILENFEKDKTLIPHTFALDEYNQKYSKFLEFISREPAQKLSEQVYEIYQDLTEFGRISRKELTKFNFFIKQLQDFENVFGAEFANHRDEILTQIENSIIAENPYSALEIADTDLAAGTPQKVIDNQIKTKYQFWLDVSSDEWIKSDTGPLYNAWVFQRGWEKESFTIEDNIELSKEKTERILRKLKLCAGREIYAFSSLFDSSGVENFGGIEKEITVNYSPQEPAQEDKPIIPRADQKPVLDYKQGKMAISAVPGAGKTTVLLALILKLMDDGINPENIFVMTYMDSAARNFRDRIKTLRPNSLQIPNISTIHGLALRILKENGNFERLDLASDFEICDDTRRSRIVRAISEKLSLKKTETEEFDRAVSVFKISGGSKDVTNQSSNGKLQKFFTFYEEYRNSLQEANLIDYDDMLISSVRLLEENPDILAYYRNITHYIIEDEAQDSSSIQQRLIELLSAKHGNLIRCGDINQAITTTFSNADVEGFRKFIDSAARVEMDCSQRCAEDIRTLANNLAGLGNRYAEGLRSSKTPFYKIFMQPVEGKNPVSSNAVQPKIFQNIFDERNYLLKVIQNIFKKDPKATVGILLRNNFQVGQWTNFINDSGLKTITRSECLEQKAVFRTIFAVMQMVLKPFDNEVIAQNYETLAELGFYRRRLGTEIRKYETPFIEMNCDDIDSMYLAQFYWDLTYWLSLTLTPEELAIKIGLHYYGSEIEKSNVYLISTLIKRLNNGSFARTAERLAELAKKPSLSGFKFFSEEEEGLHELLAGKVQVMTIHKSKGDEFDYVFLPEMTEKNLTLNFGQIKLKSADFTESIRRTNPAYKPKSENDFKHEILAENLRLLYVAITRAKKRLFFTVSTQTKSFGRITAQEPGTIFSILKGGAV
ncbi:MAG: ATP-dependent helicase [Heliobacteriaceae bacterium]|nr:ATP-dependent helicase [Heliobacteriaceae bacterium]